jgi:hypothetical protein
MHESGTYVKFTQAGADIPIRNPSRRYELTRSNGCSIIARSHQEKVD